MRGTLVIVALLAGCAQPAPMAPEPHIDPDLGLLAEMELLATFPELRFETDHGEIRIVLFTAWTPQTTGHIAALAERGFYDGTLVHRVVDDFVIQGGDRTGTGEGGSGPMGTSDPVPLEVHPGLDFGSGAVGLARWTDDTGDSQWFITEKPAPHLSRPSGPTGDVFGAYALFGQVIAGIDVVRSIAAVDTIPHLDRPVQDVAVMRAQLLAPPAADRFAFVQDVVPGFETAYGAAVLEHPRHLITQHPATLRVVHDGDCAWPELPLHITGPGNASYAPLQPVEHDACTFETQVTFDAPGTWSIAGSDVVRPGTVQVDVAGWHDAFAPHAGR